MIHTIQLLTPLPIRLYIFDIISSIKDYNFLTGISKKRLTRKVGTFSNEVKGSVPAIRKVQQRLDRDLENRQIDFTSFKVKFSIQKKNLKSTIFIRILLMETGLNYYRLSRCFLFATLNKLDLKLLKSLNCLPGSPYLQKSS